MRLATPITTTVSKVRILGAKNFECMTWIKPQAIKVTYFFQGFSGLNFGYECYWTQSVKATMQIP